MLRKTIHHLPEKKIGKRVLENSGIGCAGNRELGNARVTGCSKPPHQCYQRKAVVAGAQKIWTWKPGGRENFIVQEFSVPHRN
jgi:hypothetical protein